MKTLLSQLLTREHDVILKAGEIISQQNNAWLTSPTEYEQKARQLLNFFSVFADEYHHQKEEEILFPAISKINEVVGAGIVNELNEHHEEFRLLMSEIRNALNRKDFVSTQGQLESYLNKLKDHIAVENDELFPMAEDLLSQDELDKLYYKCIDKDNESGIDRKQALEQFIKNLERNEAVN